MPQQNTSESSLEHKIRPKKKRQKKTSNLNPNMIFQKTKEF